MAHYIGLDLGGTNIKAGIVDDAGTVLSQVSESTGAGGRKDPHTVINELVSTADHVARLAGVQLDSVSAIGVGSPGPIDFERGLVQAAPNMPGWENVPLRDLIAKKTGRPTFLENDANAAAMGEFWAGAGKDSTVRHMIMLTLGTGIGTGFVIDGQLLRGAGGFGAEGGHMIIDIDGRQCGCGQRGCLESYSSASRTAQRAMDALDAGHESSLQAMYGVKRIVTSKEVFEAAAAGDALALRIVDETAAMLGVACVNLCRLFYPQMIVFAGGMIKAGEFLFERVRGAYEFHDWTLSPSHVQIVPALLGNDAGFIGAAAVAADAHQRGTLG
jgi:glucokinase